MIDPSVFSNRPSNWINWLLQGFFTSLLVYFGYLIDRNGSILLIVLVIVVPLWSGGGMRLLFQTRRESNK